MFDSLMQPLWQQLTWALIHFIWQGAVIALAAMAVITWKVSRPTTRYNVLLVALLAMACCPLLTFAWLVATSAEPAPAIAAGYEMSHALDTSATALTGAELYRISQPYLLLLWMTGVALLGLRLTCGYLATRWLRRSRLELPQEWRARVSVLAGRLRVRDAVVYTSRRVSDATTVGLWRPLVLLPASWLLELPPEVLEAVIAHELAHVRRSDLWVNLLQRLLETLLFYHPAVWWVSSRLRLEREMCCDELAVAAIGRRAVYASALEQVARRRLNGPPLLATAFSGGRTMNLLTRVRNVLGLSPPGSQLRWWPLGIIVVAALLAIWSITAGPGQGLLSVQADEPSDALALFDGERGEGSRDGERREGEQRDGEKRGPREGDRPGPREEGHGPRDGDKGPREEGHGPRDGDKGPREGEHGPRDGERSPREEGFGPRDGEHGPMAPQAMRNLMEMIERLNREVSQLRREVNELRMHRGEGMRGEGESRGPREGFGGGERGGPREGFGGGDRPGPREGFGPRDGERRFGPRDGDAPREDAGPRDGAGPRVGEGAGPRDGEREGAGPRDGEREGAGPRDGERGPREGDDAQRRNAGNNDVQLVDGGSVLIDSN